MMLNEYSVPDKEQRITISLRFDSDSLGSQTSATDTAHKGIKPKQLSVSCLIPFVDVGDLSELTAVVQATRDDGALLVYDITDTAANAMKIRQVRFCDSFDVREDWRLKAWQVNFSLQEFQSVPEKVEQRLNKVVASAQTASGQAVGVNEPQSQPEQPLSQFEKMLAYADGVLAPTPVPSVANETT
jgi:hypothetical protein